MTIDHVGLQRLQQDGLIDSRFAFHDQDLASYPDIEQALADATLTCVGS